MSLVVRKIDYGKWIQRRILEGERPSADAITNCMKTSSNTLSLWAINGISEIDEAVLAISSQFNSLDTIDILTIELSLIKSRGLSVKECAGLTPYERFVERHLDVVDLDYTSLGLMSEVIIESIRQGRCRRVTRGELKNIISKGVEEGKVRWSDLKEKVQKIIPQKSITQDTKTVH